MYRKVLRYDTFLYALYKFLYDTFVHHEFRTVSYTHLDVYKRQLGHLLPGEVWRVEGRDSDEVPLPLGGRELRLVAPYLRHVRVRVVRVRNGEDAGVLVRGDGLDRGEDVLRNTTGLIDNGEDVGGVESLEGGLVVVRRLAPECSGRLEPGEGPLRLTCDAPRHIGLGLEILDIGPVSYTHLCDEEWLGVPGPL